MYLSRIELRPGAGRKEAFWRSDRTLYETHRLVWSWFADGPDRRRDFLYRQEGAGVSARFYTLSERPPHDTSELWSVQYKLFAPRLSPGDRLGFSLRANPVVRRAKGPGRGSRHDVVMDARFRLKEAGKPSPPVAELVQDAGRRWLAGRADANGFALVDNEVVADGYRQLTFDPQEGRRPIKISTIDFTGFLTVTDPDRFTALLNGGLGPAKAFGCGLLLVRRA